MDRELLKENRVHGDSLFPFTIYEVPFPSIGNAFNCHWHQELEFILVKEGRAMFQVDATEYEVFAGEAIFINRGQLHAGFSNQHTFCSFYALLFDPSFLFSHTYDVLQVHFIDPILKYQYALPVLIKGNTDWEKEILTKLREIVRIGNDKPYTYELLIKSYLYQVLSQMICHQTLSHDPGKYAQNTYKTERIKEILQYMQENYNKKISIQELSQKHNMSEGYFCRFFKQMVRKTPIDYLNYYRIHKAAQSLENSNSKISEIALDVGFENFSYFISTFKQYMKSTPSEYRRIKSQKTEN